MNNFRLILITHLGMAKLRIIDEETDPEFIKITKVISKLNPIMVLSVNRLVDTGIQITKITKP